MILELSFIKKLVVTLLNKININTYFKNLTVEFHGH